LGVVLFVRFFFTYNDNDDDDDTAWYFFGWITSSFVSSSLQPVPFLGVNEVGLTV